MIAAPCSPADDEGGRSGFRETLRDAAAGARAVASLARRLAGKTLGAPLAHLSIMRPRAEHLQAAVRGGESTEPVEVIPIRFACTPVCHEAPRVAPPRPQSQSRWLCCLQTCVLANRWVRCPMWSDPLQVDFPDSCNSIPLSFDTCGMLLLLCFCSERRGEAATPGGLQPRLPLSTPRVI